MMQRRFPVLCAIALALLVTPARPSLAQKLVSAGDAAESVRIRNLTVSGTTLSGELENASSETLQDVRLLIRYAWLWKDERNPGEDNPGRAEFFTVRGNIAPGARRSFTYTPDPPLPYRGDGSYMPSAEVVDFTQTAP